MAPADDKLIHALTTAPLGTQLTGSLSAPLTTFTLTSSSASTSSSSGTPPNPNSTPGPLSASSGNLVASAAAARQNEQAPHIEQDLSIASKVINYLYCMSAVVECVSEKKKEKKK